MKKILIPLCLTLVAACSDNTSTPPAKEISAERAPVSESPTIETTGAALADQFMDALRPHCGKAYTGQVVSTDEADADFAAKPLKMHVRSCTADEIRIPFHVGDDRSRTWVITRTADGLRLKHDHRHEDGTEDAVTQYGGDSGSITLQRTTFPVDQESIDLFLKEGLDVSVTNIWALDITPSLFAYELSRENRFFRTEFDLTAPVSTPPPPWGASTNGEE